MTREVDASTPYRSEIRLVFWQSLAFVIRAAQFAFAVAVHYGIHVYVLPLAIPAGWTAAHKLFEVLFFVAFAVMYVQQLFDIVTIIVPWLRQRRNAASEK